MKKFIEELLTAYEYIKSNSFTQFNIHKIKKNSILFSTVKPFVLATTKLRKFWLLAFFMNFCNGVS